MPWKRAGRVPSPARHLVGDEPTVNHTFALSVAFRSAIASTTCCSISASFSRAALMIKDHPNRSLTQLVGILPSMLMVLTFHGSILSKSGVVSTKPGAIQSLT